MVFDLGAPFRRDVLEAGGRDDGEADEEDVRLRVGEWAEAVVVLLAGGIPQTWNNKMFRWLWEDVRIFKFR